MTKQLAIGIAALALCLALVGCGGSGGGEPTVTQTVHDELQAELDAVMAELRETEGERNAARRERNTARTDVARLNTELATAKASVVRLEGQIGGMDDEADDAASASLHAQLNHANAEVTRLTGVIGAAADDASDADGASLHAQLKYANAEVTKLTARIGSATDSDSLQGMLAAAKAEATRLTTQLTTANANLRLALNAQGTSTQRLNSLQTQLTAAQTEVTRLRGEVTRLTALVPAGATPTDTTGTTTTGTGTTTTLSAAQQAVMSARSSKLFEHLVITDVETDRLGASVAWRRLGSLQASPTGSFTRGTTAPSVPGNWRSSSHTSPGGTATQLSQETAYLYTNIQPPGTKHFWKKHGVPPVTDFRGGVAKVSSQSVTTKTTNPGTQNVKTTIAGTFDGVRGTFSCAGEAADCLATPDPNTNVITFTGSWTFPASLTAGIPLDQDEAYIYFGIWASEPVDITGTGNSDFKFISGGRNGSGTSTLNTNFAALTGKATFRGGAIGMYATKSQFGQPARVGTFTATATLDADFGPKPDNNQPDTVVGTLSGTITNFREGGSSLAGWSVAMGGTNIGTPVDISDTQTATGSTVASIGGLTVGGTWGAELYGVSNQVLPDRTKYPEARYPVAEIAGVTGWFNAGTAENNAVLAGAFGAQ